jgi:hypothetical protein
VIFTSGTLISIPSKFLTSTFGKTSYLTANVKSFVVSKSGISSIVGCEYGNGRSSDFSLSSSSKISPRAFSTISATASFFNASPYFFSRTDTGTFPLRKPGI